MGENVPAITTKQGLIDYTTTEWEAFVAYVDSLPPERWTGPKDAAGWSVKDHVSHVTQWDRAVIELLRNGRPMQETLDIPDAAWAAESYDPMNEVIRRLAATGAVHQVQADRDATWTALTALMGDLSEEQLARPGEEFGLAIGAMPHAGSVLQVLAEYWGAHYAEHHQDIKSLVAGEG